MCHIVIVLVSVAVLVSVIVISVGTILFKKNENQTVSIFSPKSNDIGYISNNNKNTYGLFII